MLELDGVALAYGAIEAVKGVSLTVERGEVVTLIGANGAGKSTLLKGIVGLHAPKSGRILVDGVDIGAVPAHRRVGLGLALVPEGRGVFPDQTVRDNLLLGAYAQRRDEARCRALLQREFERFPRLQERESQLAGTLSGGEQQMLAISRALMSEPKLLLLDEPSLGLAPKIIAEIFQTIRALRDDGLTLLLVEQMANQALAVADRAYVLETGVITCQGSGAELLRDPKVRAAYLGGTDGPPPKRLPPLPLEGGAASGPAEPDPRRPLDCAVSCPESGVAAPMDSRHRGSPRRPAPSGDHR